MKIESKYVEQAGYMKTRYIIISLVVKSNVQVIINNIAADNR